MSDDEDDDSVRVCTAHRVISSPEKSKKALIYNIPSRLSRRIQRCSLLEVGQNSPGTNNRRRFGALTIETGDSVVLISPQSQS